MIFFDFETCGFHGVATFLQYAEDDSDVVAWDIWKEKLGDTLAKLEHISSQSVCGFNLAFDWFHFQKLYTLFLLSATKYGYDIVPEDFINEIALLEEQASELNVCIKPKAALDLLLYSRKGPYQSLMRRKPIVIRKFPDTIVGQVHAYLQENIEIDPIFCPSWKIKDSDIAGFSDIVLNLKSSSSLKALSKFVLGKEDVIQYKDIEPKKHPYEAGWAPYATAHSEPPYWIVRIGTQRHFTWPMLVQEHANHWKYNSLARKYGVDDVINTRDLYKAFKAKDPELAPGDDDSELAVCVGAVRWRGYSLNQPLIKALRDEAENLYPGVPTAPKQAHAYISEHMDEIEKFAFTDTKGQTLEVIRDDPDWQDHPSAIRAGEVIQKRSAQKEVQLYNKLIKARRFHPSFNVIGTLSSRMSGRDDLNPQGINRESKTRECFSLADPGFILCGGDFDAFEVVLTDAAFADPALRSALQSGKKIHALFACKMFPDKTYEQILDSKGTDTDLYTLGKNGVFSMIYGGTWETLHNRYGVEEETAKKAYYDFLNDYPVLRDKRAKIENDFLTLRQKIGGGAFTFSRPVEFIESLTGFRRYFTLENSIVEQLWDLCNNIPKEWKSVSGRFVRNTQTGKQQSAAGACMSALFAAACGLQGRNFRAAANHIIQSAGAIITKRVQRRIWDLQPSGVHKFVVVPMNVHDEVLCPCQPDYADLVEETVKETVESYREQVPLIEMGWQRGAASWAALK